jgi:hypothetical protein
MGGQRRSNSAKRSSKVPKPAKTGVKQAKMDLFAYLRPPETTLTLGKPMVRGGQRYQKTDVYPSLGTLLVLVLGVSSPDCPLIIAGINFKTLISWEVNFLHLEKIEMTK